MIFKVYYQDSISQMPVREKTKTLFLEAQSEREVRQKLKDRPFNIEFVQVLEGAYLEYEEASHDFKLTETNL